MNPESGPREEAGTASPAASPLSSGELPGTCARMAHLQASFTVWPPWFQRAGTWHLLGPQAWLSQNTPPLSGWSPTQWCLPAEFGPCQCGHPELQPAHDSLVQQKAHGPLLLQLTTHSCAFSDQLGPWFADMATSRMNKLLKTHRRANNFEFCKDRGFFF